MGRKKGDSTNHEIIYPARATPTKVCTESIGRSALTPRDHPSTSSAFCSNLLSNSGTGVKLARSAATMR